MFVSLINLMKITSSKMMVGMNVIFGFTALVLRPASTNSCFPRFVVVQSSTCFQSILVQLAHY